MKKTFIPTRCPSCSSILEISKTGVDLYCKNSENCQDQIVGRLKYYCQRQNANIIGLSEKIIEKFVLNLGIKDVDELYKLPFNQIENWEGFGEKSIYNLKESIEKSKTSMDTATFLASLGVEGIGKEVAKLIIKCL